jgi:iron(III) transport system permease protein
VAAMSALNVIDPDAPQTPREAQTGVQRLIRARRSSGSRTNGIIVLVVVAAVTVVPIGLLLYNSLNVAVKMDDPYQFGFGNWEAAFANAEVWSAVWNTVALGVPRVIIGIIFATVIAWTLSRTNIPGGKIIEVLLWFAFFIPSLATVMGWVMLADQTTGIINQVLRMLPWLSDLTTGPLNITSYWGIIWVHLTHSTIPVSVIFLVPTFRRMNRALEEAAQISGAGKFQTMFRITIPVMRPAILSATLISLIYSLKAFEIELILGNPIGLNVYSTKIYTWLNDNPPNFGSATAIGVLFLPILVILAILHRLAIRERSFVTVGSHTYNDDPVDLGVWKWIITGVLYLWIFITVVLPLGAILVGSFMTRFGFFNITTPWTTEHWGRMFGAPAFGSAMQNSIMIGLLATVTGIIVYFLIAFAITRSEFPTRGAIDVMAWMPAALPGILLGLGLLWMYLGTPLRTVLYGNLLGLTIALVIGHMSTATQQMKAALLQVSPDLDRAARVAGAGPIRAYLYVLFPLLGPSVAAAAVLTFHAAIADTSTVVLLSTSSSRPLSLLLLQFTTNSQLEQGAALGVILSAVTVIVAITSRVITGRRLKTGSTSKSIARPEKSTTNVA